MVTSNINMAASGVNGNIVHCSSGILLYILIKVSTFILLCIHVGIQSKLLFFYRQIFRRTKIRVWRVKRFFFKNTYINIIFIWNDFTMLLLEFISVSALLMNCLVGRLINSVSERD